MSLLQALSIMKSFNDHLVLDNVNLNLNRSQILCLLGPSGCGKTTLLRIIAGLEQADAGEIRFKNDIIDDVPPYKRQFGMMFQDFALFPHKTVFENVAYGLNIQKRPKSKIMEQISKILQTVNLEGFEHRNVNDLSGGERQRVALARSLAPEPQLLMLDEPLGALDRSLRERLLIDMSRILKKVGVTTIWVTHDQSEAYAIADSIGVMINGQIIQVASPEMLYKKPDHKLVAEFLGFHNILKGKIRDKNTIETESGLLLPNTGKLSEANQEITVLIRPEAAELIKSGMFTDQLETVIEGEMRFCLFKGLYYQISVKIASGQQLHFHISNENTPPQPGDNIRLTLNPEAIVIIPND